MSKILIPLAKGFEEIEAVTLIDVLRRAELDVVVAGVGSKTVLGAQNISIESDKLITELNSNDFDMIVLPGGWDGTHALADNADVQRILKEMNQKNKLIGAICAAPYALNRAGVLKHNYTCYPSVEDEIRVDGYNDNDMVVTDENIMTSRGPATALCFALKIVEKLKGEEVSNQLKNALLARYC